MIPRLFLGPFSLAHLSDGGDYGQVTVGRKRREGEDGHAHGDVLHELAELALEGAVGPGIESVDGGDEWHSEEEDQEVAQGQGDDVGIGHIAQRLVPHEDHDQGSVACRRGEEGSREH